MNASARPGDGLIIPRLAIIGVGLIGGSLALALKHRGAVGQVVGAGRSRATLQSALQRGVIDAAAESAAAAAQDADVIVLAAPVNAIAQLLTAVLPVIKPEAVVTDVGSVKFAICRAAAELGGRCGRFVGGHPVAGKERSGVAAANAMLFDNHNVVLTPDDNTDADAVNTVKNIWQTTGANVTTMNAAEHDRVLALTSHLPHILAYAMVDVFAASDDVARGYEMAAGGFYDFTRIASSDAEMWRDIFLMNRGHSLDCIDNYARNLNRVRKMIAAGDAAGMEKLFRAAKTTRARFTERRKQN